MSKKPMISHHVASAASRLRHVFVRDLETEALQMLLQNFLTARVIRRKRAAGDEGFGEFECGGHSAIK